MISLEKLVESGCHFGHRVSRWNPKMKPYIHGKRNLIHIIDLRETVRGLIRAQHFLHNVVAAGHQIVVVGTKRAVKNVVASEAKRAGMPYVNERWLGGTLTNFKTVRSRLKRLLELEELESSGRLYEMPKKAQSFLMRELRRIRRNLDGIRDLERLPGAMLVIDARKEYIAINEANRLNIPIVCILDTDCDPSNVDFPIPGNDDAMRSVQALLNPLVDSICEGKANARELAESDRRAMSPDVEDIPSVRHRPGGGGAQRQRPTGPRRDRDQKAAPAEPKAAAAEAPASGEASPDAASPKVEASAAGGDAAGAS